MASNSDIPPTHTVKPIDPPPSSDQPTPAMLKADIDSGRTGDKVGVLDPGLSSLVLQLRLRVGFALMALPVTVLGHGLMDAPPQRPAEEMIEHYAGRTLQAANELADLAHAEGDQRSRLRSPLLCDVTALSFTRRAARKPKASMASVMCRYQPCQERIS